MLSTRICKKQICCQKKKNCYYSIYYFQKISKSYR